MLGLSKKTIFAVEAVLDIAYNAGAAPVQAAEITRRQEIPKRYLEPALQQLVRAGILTGVRGPRGGYRLGRERSEITLGDVWRVVEGADPAEWDPQSGSDLGRKVLHPLWTAMRDEAIARLDAITLQQLCDKAREAGVASDSAERLDFTI